MRILVVLHRKKRQTNTAPSRLGRLYHGLLKAGAVIEERSVYDLPSEPRCYDLIFIMGARASLSSASSESWMRAEYKFIEYILRHTIPCVGICFGAQHIAKVLGSTITRLPNVEIGVQSVKIAASNPTPLKKDFVAMKFHNDAFLLPPGSTAFAYSHLGFVDGFSYNNHILAFQAHPEMTVALFTEYWSKCIAHNVHADLRYKVMQDIYRYEAALNQSALDCLDSIFALCPAYSA